MGIVPTLSNRRLTPAEKRASLNPRIEGDPMGGYLIVAYFTHGSSPASVCRNARKLGDREYLINQPGLCRLGSFFGRVQPVAPARV
jgi:hypothetical protein